MNFKNQSYTGYWFTPDQKKRWYGTLSFSEKNDIYLDFVSTNEEIKESVPQVFSQGNNINDQEKIPIIYGYGKSSIDNKDLGFTLLELELVNFSRSGLFKVTLEAKYAITYNHILKPQKAFISTVMLKFDGFDKWIDKNGFDVTEDYETKQVSTALGFKQPDPITLIDNSEIKAYFYFRANYPAFFVRGPKAVIEQSLYLNLEFKTLQKLDTIISYNEKAQNFFTFIFSLPTARTDCQIRISKKKNAETIDLIYLEAAPDHSIYIAQGSYMFYYPEHEDKFPAMFENWFELYKNYEPALDQYFDNKYYDNGHVVSKFVSILSILEIYYHRKFQQEKSLGDKLKDIIGILGPIANLFNFEDGFSKEVVQIRKYFVHGRDTRRNTGEEKFNKDYISKLVRKLENIFRIMLLLELGLSEDEIIKLIKRKPWQWGLNFP